MTGLIRKLALAALLVGAIAGCATAPAEYAGAARQGVEFQDAMVNYTEAAKAAAVASRTHSMTSSLGLMDDGAERLELYDATVEGILRGIELHGVISEHAALMRTYFVQLQALASADVPQEAAAATAGTIGALNRLSNQLLASDAISGEATGIVGELVALGISLKQRRVLAQELQSNGPFIEEQILLQIEALDYMAGQLGHDIENVIEQQKNIFQMLLIEGGDLDAYQASKQATDLILAHAASPGDAPAAGRELLASWRSLIRRATGQLTLAELYASLESLSGEVQAMEATTAALRSTLE